MSKITVVIPTLHKSMFILKMALQILNDHPLVKEIFIFDNTEPEDKTINPAWVLPKVTVFNDKNFYVNQAWNEGVALTQSEYYLLLNDDVIFNAWVIDNCAQILDHNPDVKLVSVDTRNFIEFNDDVRDPIISFDFENIKLQGWFMMGRKEEYVPIDKRLLIFFGDNLLYLNATKTGKVARLTTNFIYHATSTTVKANKIYESGVLQDEERIFKEIIGDKSIKILIGTPSYDFTLHAMYVESLIQTEALCRQKNINCAHIFLCGDALIQRARNDIFKIAYENNFDKLVFIDNDMFWKPEDFLKLISFDYDIVGAPCRKKSDENVDFNVTIFDRNIDENDIMKVRGVGTGFLAISRKAIKALYESSQEYFDKGKNTKTRLVFDIAVVDGELYSEDIMFCKKWRDMGGDIYVDANMTIGHVGTKNYVGNLKEFILATNDKK